jgi:hypothetical protein
MMNGECEKNGKSVHGLVETLFRHLREKLGNDRKNIAHISQLPSRDSDPVPPEYKYREFSLGQSALYDCSSNSRDIVTKN